MPHAIEGMPKFLGKITTMELQEQYPSRSTASQVCKMMGKLTELEAKNQFGEEGLKILLKRLPEEDFLMEMEKLYQMISKNQKGIESPLS